MSLLTPETASVYGALDSTAVADGDLPDAEIIRRMVIGANRMMCSAGEPLLNELFDDGGTVTETPSGGLTGYAPPRWTQIRPGPITRFKKTGLTKAKLFIRAYARSGEVLYVQLATRAYPFSAAADGSYPNTLKIDGNGAWQWHSKADIPIHYESSEELTVYLRGEITSTAGSTGTYGSLNTGTLEPFPDANTLYDANSNWNTSGATYANGGHAVVFIDGSGNEIAPSQWIVGVPDPTHLAIVPGLDPMTRQALLGATYAIRELPRWRIANIALYPTARTP